MTPATLDEQDRADMARLVAGHDPALDELMGRHAERLYSYLLRVVQNESDAAELAEESFVRVYQNRGRFRSANRFSTWLYTIATNLARDLQRELAIRLGYTSHPGMRPNGPRRSDGPSRPFPKS